MRTSPPSRLRFVVPRGWAVHRNDFYDSDANLFPGETPTDHDVAFLLHHPVPWEPAPRETYGIDLDWRPDPKDALGIYRLTLLWCDWNDIVAQWMTSDRNAVRDALESWLDLVVRAKDRPQLERWIEADLPGAVTAGQTAPPNP